MLTYLVKRNRYVSAKEVFDYMNQEFKGVSYDTIYRNLHDFAEIDLLEETDLNGEMKFRFIAVKGNRPSPSLYLYGVRNNERNPYVSNELFRRTARWMYDQKGIDSRFSEDVKIVNKDLNKITFDNFKKQDFLDGQNSIRYNIYRTVLFLRYISITITVTF